MPFTSPQQERRLENISVILSPCCRSSGQRLSARVAGLYVPLVDPWRICRFWLWHDLHFVRSGFFAMAPLRPTQKPQILIVRISFNYGQGRHHPRGAAGDGQEKRGALQLRAGTDAKARNVLVGLGVAEGSVVDKLPHDILEDTDGEFVAGAGPGSVCGVDCPLERFPRTAGWWD